MSTRPPNTQVPKDPRAPANSLDAVESAPKVSVVIPTHNRGAMLPRAVQSVLSQTFEDLELIVVDDHSDDRTPQVLAGFTDKRVRSLRHPRNVGQSKALNTGINAARGAYVAFLDDDDVWLPDKLALQVAALDAAPPQVGLIYGWRQDMDDASNSPIGTVRKTLSGDIYEHMLALDTPVPPSSWLMRTSVVRTLGGFDESIHRAKDVEFVCRFCERGWHVDYVPSVVFHRYEHKNGQMSDTTPQNLALREAFIHRHLARFKDELRQRPAAQVRVYLQLARIQFPFRRFVGALSIANAFGADPDKWTKKLQPYSRWLYYRLRESTQMGAQSSGRRFRSPAKPPASLY